MSNKDDKRKEEKERLWNEVMNKNRTYSSENETIDDITLEVGDGSSKVENATEHTSNTLRSASSALDALNSILKKQQKELQQLTEETHKEVNRNVVDDVDVNKLEQELNQDYGVVEPVTEQNEFDSKAVFDQVASDVKKVVVGQDQAVQALATAFRRPYVMGSEEGKAKNVILVTGPKGSGKHTAITSVVASLTDQKVFTSKEVYTLDLSRYTSGSQEQIFIQDLYRALIGTGSVICFENFEACFPSFLRMIDTLVTEGSVVLNKRYVLTKGVLVENQTGLVKDAIDHIDANGKYLLFITDKKASKVQDAFGADFMNSVLDTVTFVALDDTGVQAYVDNQTEALKTKANDKLKVSLTVTEDVKNWVKEHYDKTQGREGIATLFYDMYVVLSQVVLDQNLGANEDVDLEVKDENPVVTYNEVSVLATRSKTSEAELKEINEELDEIVGLEKVKEYIRSIEAHVKVQAQRREQGMKTAEVSKHMIFTGNPGTGKTTIARLLSRYMKAIGALSQGQLVEVTRADLVAQYVGQTAPLTMSVIKSAIGGVLFIDEAYSLYRGKDDAFGLECIDTLVKAMEDNRDNLIVILAGYSKEMSTFLEANSGLKSRFPNIIEFPDYTGEQLVKITELQAKGKGYVIEEAALSNLKDFYDKVQASYASEAGNGRLARNEVEDAILKQSKRIENDKSADMSLLKDEDFDYTEDFNK